MKMSKGQKICVSFLQNSPQTIVMLSQVCFKLSYLNIRVAEKQNKNLTWYVLCY